MCRRVKEKAEAIFISADAFMYIIRWPVGFCGLCKQDRRVIGRFENFVRINLRGKIGLNVHAN